MSDVPAAVFRPGGISFIAGRPSPNFILNVQPERARELGRAIFLDRDGTINAMVYDPDHGTVDSPLRPDQLRLLPGAAQAIRRLKAIGFLTVVVSNQPVVAKGKTSLGLLESTTARLLDELAAEGAAPDAIYYCLHHPDGVVAEYALPCGCRKPGHGLLVQAADDLGIDLGRSYMVGDGLTDVQAGRSAGCRTVWLGSPRCDWCGAALDHDVPSPDAIVPSLIEAAKLIAVHEQVSESVNWTADPEVAPANPHRWIGAPLAADVRA